MIYLLFTLPIIMSILSRMAGGGFYKAKYDWQDRIPEILFAFPFAYVAYLHSPWLALPAYVSTFLAMETGHGTAFGMGFAPIPTREQRRQFLDNVIELFYDKRDVTYCWIFMGLKGAWIGLALFPFGLPLILLWPLSYYIGRRTVYEVAEYLSGFFAGCACAYALYFF